MAESGKARFFLYLPIETVSHGLNQWYARYEAPSSMYVTKCNAKIVSHLIRRLYVSGYRLYDVKVIKLVLRGRLHFRNTTGFKVPKIVKMAAVL